MTAQEALKEIKSLGINEISEGNLKLWFAKRPLIVTTGAEIKEQAKLCGIELKRCDSVIPIDFMPVEEYQETEVFEAPRTKTFFTKEEMKSLYFEQKLSIDQIIKIKDCTRNTFYEYFRLFGFKLRAKTTRKSELEPQVAEIADMYLNKRLNLHQVAAKYKTTTKMISDLLKENGYKRRKSGALNMNYINKNMKVSG